MEKIPFDDFKKVELRTAKILAAERVEGSEKLVKLALDVGEKDATGLPVARQIVAGIGKEYDPAALVGRQIVIVANLEPRTLLGIESNGMLLAAMAPDGTLSLLSIDKEMPPGSIIS